MVRAGAGFDEEKRKKPGRQHWLGADPGRLVRPVNEFGGQSADANETVSSPDPAPGRLVPMVGTLGFTSNPSSVGIPIASQEPQ
jgi:hypothetical protein